MNTMTAVSKAPVVWSVAGTDSGGGAGHAADQRAADAFGVHLCTVVAAVTAQNSRAVTRVQAVDAELLDAQLAALAGDMPPLAIKTGLLGSAANVRVLARWVDRLRAERPERRVALVVDPVLRASTSAELADAELRAAWRDELLPRADVITPNRAEAAALLGLADLAAADVPAAARALQGLGPMTVCITGGDAGSGHTGHPDDAAMAHDWLMSPHASGWLSAPRTATRHTHGTGCTFATVLASALALGFVSADAAVLAKMAVADALSEGADAVPPGAGPGPVRARAGFASARVLPWLSLDETLPVQWPQRRPWQEEPAAPPAPGLYAIVDSAERVAAVLAAGVKTVQLRIKTAPGQIPETLRQDIARSIAAARAVGARLYVNDHWALALELGADAIHLGQEDLLALRPTERAQLIAAQALGLALGISSHSLWELCRAAALQPSYVACGPVWPTETKRMPWRAQGLPNLAWWCAVAPAPVVAIGGILTPAQAAEAARCGAAGVCVVRGLSDHPAHTVPAFEAALRFGRTQGRLRAPDLPHSALAV